MSITNKNCGIYKITSPTGRIYIGQTINIERRWNNYYSSIGANSQPRLKNSFKKYGVENHQFDIIEYCSEEELDCSERFWQDEFDVTNKNNLNCSLTKCGEKRYKHSEETCKKISELNKGKKTKPIKSDLNTCPGICQIIAKPHNSSFPGVRR